MNRRRNPKDNKSKSRGEGTDQNIKAFGSEARGCTVCNVPHDGIGDGVPDMADQRNQSRQRGRHPHGLDQKNRKKGIDDDKGAAVEKLAHAVHHLRTESDTVCFFAAHKVSPPVLSVT